jgi:gliding motility-associated lipoprotein GldD
MILSQLNSMIEHKKILYMLITTLSFLFSGCGQTYTPKPHAWFRIDFPEKEYMMFDSAHYPYRFEYPAYAKIKKDKGRIAEPYWINISFPEYNAKIHLSYKEIQDNLTELIEDSRILAYKHSIKADAINERMFIDRENDVYGLLYNIQGNAASSVQFFISDSVQHFLRGALYFRARPNFDSLKPAVEFFRKDIVHLIETTHWNSTDLD